MKMTNVENRNMRRHVRLNPRYYGIHLQTTGKQVWTKKKKK